MHEAAMIGALMPLVEEEARRFNVKKVTKICLNVGVLTAVEPQTLVGCFEIFAEGTVAEGAELAVKKVSAVSVCRECDCRFSLQNLRGCCPECGGMRLDISGGRDFCITGIHAC